LVHFDVSFGFVIVQYLFRMRVLLVISLYFLFFSKNEKAGRKIVFVEATINLSYNRAKIYKETKCTRKRKWKTAGKQDDA